MKKVVVLLLALMMLLAACTPAAPGVETPAAEDGNRTFAIVTKSAGNPFMERMASGFQTAANAMGVTAVVQHPEDTTAEAQIVVINTLIAQGVDGIAIAANDPNALESAIQSAREQGIVVITLDSDTAGSQLFVNQAGV